MPSFSKLAIVSLFTIATLVGASPISQSKSGSILQKRSLAPFISRCTLPGTIAITFDDGPYTYTRGLLDILKSRGVKATFFFNGDNFGRIEDYAAFIKRAYRDGHQIASHTWSHKYLPGLDPSEALAEVTLLEDALKNIIGVRPTYLRPPYGAIDRPTLELLGERNYTVVGWDIDTQDWAHSDDAEASLKYYRTLFNNTEEINKPGHIVLQHEVYQTTSLHVAPVAIDLALINGYKVVTVGECIGDDKSNWYSD